MTSIKHSSISEILYFNPEPNREGHASYTHVHEIIENLRILGWSVDYYSPDYTSKALPTPLSRISGIGKSLLKAIFRRQPKIIYMRWHFAAFPLSLWARLCHIPVVIEVNGPVTDLYIAWPITSKFKFVFSWLMQVQLRWSSAIISVTEGLATLCAEISGADKVIKVIPNGANTQHFHPDAASSPLAVDGIPESFCVFFGTMAQWQGIDDLLTAIDDLDWPIDCPLLVAGDGERRAATEAMARKHPDKLRYLGRLPYKELPKLIARSRFSFVCTQNLDGRASSGMAPLKLFETLSCGVPVIATKMPYQADLVREAGAGVLVDENQPDQILKAAHQLLENPLSAKEMGRRGRAFVENHHSWQARAKETHDLLISIVPKKK